MRWRPLKTRKSKFGAKRTVYNGVSYASRAEATRAQQLDAMRMSSAIRFWVGQPLFRLGCPENTYRPDFLIVGSDGHVWAEDVKGVETAAFRRNRKLWARYGPCELRILRRRQGGWTSEVIDVQERVSRARED